MSGSWFAQSVLLCSIALAPPADTDAGRAATLLENKGLILRGAYYVLPEEITFSRRLGHLRDVKLELTRALDKQRQFEEVVQRNQQLIRKAIDERRRLNNRLADARTVLENNRLVGRINALTDRIELLQDESSIEKHGQAVDAEVATARRRYMDEIRELKDIHDQLRADYERLSQDPEIAAALDTINQERKRPVKFGPRKNFQRKSKDITKLASTIEQQAVNLRREHNVLWIEAQINGRCQQSMILDTGASFVTLPADVAAACGLSADEDDPIMYIQVADGRVLPARHKVLESLSIGRFSAKNVACVIMPADAENAPTLLGGSFLSRFVYQIDHAGETLQLYRVNTSK